MVKINGRSCLPFVVLFVEKPIAAFLAAMQSKQEVDGPAVLVDGALGHHFVLVPVVERTCRKQTHQSRIMFFSKRRPLKLIMRVIKAVFVGRQFTVYLASLLIQQNPLVRIIMMPFWHHDDGVRIKPLIFEHVNTGYFFLAF